MILKNRDYILKYNVLNYKNDLVVLISCEFIKNDM